MSAWSFEHPERLRWVAATVAIVVGLILLDRSRRRAALRRLGDAAVLAPLLASASAGRWGVRHALTLIACALIAIGVAGPRRATDARVVERRLDLVVALDVSTSMLVEDVSPDRLARARELALQTLDALPDDHSAAVLFAAAAAHFPMTRDHEVTAHFLTSIGPADLPRGSNLAEALRVSRCLLRRDVGGDLRCRGVGQVGRGGDPLPGDREDVRPRFVDELDPQAERGRAIVLFTDGAEPDDEALVEAAAIQALGIRLILVGVGTEAGGEVWDIDADGRRTAPKRDAGGKPIVSKREDETLRQIAGAAGAGGTYLIAREGGAPNATEIVETLTALARPVGSRMVRRAEGVQSPFLFAAFMLLLIEASLRGRRRTAGVGGGADAEITAPRSSPRAAAWMAGLAIGVGGLLVVVAVHMVRNPGREGFASAEQAAAACAVLAAITGGLLVRRAWARRHAAALAAARARGILKP